jgi:two-component system sensor histidine kinase DesK
MITLKAEYARRLLTKAPEKVPEQLLEIEQASRHNLQMVRDIVTDLRQVTIAEELIQQEQNLRVAGMLLFTKNEVLSKSLSQTNQQVLAQCIHEAVTNMIRYSRASECDIQFEQLATRFQMKISDNGRGLRDSDQVKSNGIPGMRERLATLNGELMITSNRSGTCLTIEIPAEGVQA